MEVEKQLVTSLTLPRHLIDKLDKVAKAEDRSRSYIARRILAENLLPVGELSAEDEKAVLEARAEYERGDAVDLTELLDEMDDYHGLKGKKTNETNRR